MRVNVSTIVVDIQCMPLNTQTCVDKHTHIQIHDKIHTNNDTIIKEQINIHTCEQLKIKLMN